MSTANTAMMAPTRCNIDRQKLSDFGIDPKRFDLIINRVHSDVQSGRYPGAALAIARQGQVLASAAFGQSRLATGDKPMQLADKDTLWLLYSQTKPIVSAALWLMAERGQIDLHQPVATYIANFARHGKQNLTVYHLLTHQAGFPNQNVPDSAWQDHQILLDTICDYKLDFEPGSRVSYHSFAAHWVQAALIEQISGQDYRQFVKEQIIDALALKNLYLGVPQPEHERLAGSYYLNAAGEHVHSHEFDHLEFWQAGVPGAGGYATADDVALFYQMLLNQGTLNKTNLLSPAMVRYVTRNHTGDRPDEFFGAPMHRGLGVHVRGTTATIRGLGSLASAATFGHGGVGTSYSFACPSSGVSFTYLTNSRLPEPGHGQRLEEIINMVHASIMPQ
ncbi:MAG: Beta-lactamase family protein [Cyanobacteriota bacterium erpe_2018_sw_39hr_WHONDRS-SW48-000098_B_bin.30]|jgi:CubicO group peptidase (beta-lactamase class C family)|nr:Beta-lactamase family protein [Cyanobacteriota bacterium erpe_2018_sw_39hr_WHONDRS-SW48-000098_B_bin.30]